MTWMQTSQTPGSPQPMPSGIGGGASSIVDTSLTAARPSGVGRPGRSIATRALTAGAAGDSLEPRELELSIEGDVGEPELGVERERAIHVGDPDADVIDPKRETWAQRLTHRGLPS